MWFGTEAGLCKFDGIKCKTYQSDANDSFSLHGNHVYAINSDGLGQVCVLTERGLNIYDGANDNFSFYAFPRVPSSSTSHVEWQIIKLNDGNILAVVGDNPYFIFDDRLKIFFAINFEDGLRYRLLDAESKGRRFCVPSPGRRGLLLWNSSANGIESNTIVFKADKKNADTVFVNGFTCLKDSTLWAATSVGLASYNIKDGANHVYTPPAQKEISFSSMVKIGNIFWLGSEKFGLWKFDIITKTFIAHYSHDATDIKSVDENGPINIFFADRQGNIWFSVFARGLDYFNEGEQKFAALLGDKEAKEKGLDNFVRALAQDSSGNVWCGTYTGSVYRFNAQRQIIAQYSGDKTGRKFASIEKILVDNKKRIWVVDDGLNFYDTAKQNFVRVFSGSTQPFAHDLFLAHDNTLYFIDNKYSIGVLTGSGNNFSYTTTNIKNVLNNLSVFFVDNNNNVYVNDVDGNIRVYKPRGNYIYSNPVMLPVHGYIKAYYQHNSTVWIATSSGVVKLAAPSFAYRLFTVKNGLPENTVYSLLPGGSSTFWLSTNRGISRFDTLAEKFTNYTTDDGLQSNEFNTNAYVLCKTGEIWFGGIHGLNVFQPASVKKDTTFPPIQITSLNVNDERYYGVNTVENNAVVSLPYAQRTVSFNFSAFEFMRPSSVSLQYHLQGFDHDWITTTNPGFARYANLPAGKYTLQVRAANSSGTWGNSIKTLQVIIATPYYQTWWFIVLICAAVIGLFYAWYYYRITQIKKMHMVRNRIARDLHDDIGSSISSISIMTGIAKDSLEKNPVRSSELIKKIGAESQQVMDSIRDIVWTINPENDMLGNMFIRMQEYTAEMLENSNIDYTFETGEHLQSIKLSMQKRRDLYLIFKEAVNNMAKYSQSTFAEIKIYRTLNKLVLCIKDNGVGFDINEVKMGNGLKNMQQRAIQLKARVDIQSEKGKGTAIRLEIPVT